MLVKRPKKCFWKEDHELVFENKPYINTGFPNLKFANLKGFPWRPEIGYYNISMARGDWDSNCCTVNPEFLAVVVKSKIGGAFIVVPLQKTGRLDVNHPLVAGHKGAVLGIAWCPFNDTVIASGCEDGVIRVWCIPDGGLTRPLVEPVVELFGHQRRAGTVLWHPAADNILLSAGSDCKVFIWNVGTGEMISEMDHSDTIFHCCFNWNGSRLVTTCNDKKIRIFDPRNGELKAESTGHDGAKPQKAIYLRNGTLLTVGFSGMNERQYALRKENALSDPIVLERLDTGDGPLCPFYDPAVNLLYFSARGDSSIYYFEVTEESPYIHYIGIFETIEPQHDMCMMPKRGCDVCQCEIGRFYKLHSRGLCEVITFTVPRESEHLQDLYPDTLTDIPALNAEEWSRGKDVDPLLMSLENFVSSTKKPEFVCRRKWNIPEESNNIGAMPESSKSGG